MWRDKSQMKAFWGNFQILLHNVHNYSVVMNNNSIHTHVQYLPILLETHLSRVVAISANIARNEPGAHLDAAVLPTICMCVISCPHLCILHMLIIMQSQCSP